MNGESSCTHTYTDTDTGTETDKIPKLFKALRLEYSFLDFSRLGISSIHAWSSAINFPV